MKSRTLADRLILKDIPIPETSKNGIIIPGILKDAPGKAEVMQKGPLCSCEVGDIVLYSKPPAVLIDLADGTYITMRETPDNILIINPDQV